MKKLGSIINGIKNRLGDINYMRPNSEGKSPLGPLEILLKGSLWGVPISIAAGICASQVPVETSDIKRTLIGLTVGAAVYVGGYLATLKVGYHCFYHEEDKFPLWF